MTDSSRRARVIQEDKRQATSMTMFASLSPIPGIKVTIEADAITTGAIGEALKRAGTSLDSSFSPHTVLHYSSLFVRMQSIIDPYDVGAVVSSNFGLTEICFSMRKRETALGR
jgi:hypothetical protein